MLMYSSNCPARGRKHQMNIALAKIAATGALVATLVTSALPLTASAGELHNRFVNQQRRIAQGVESGRLTWGEYRADEARLQSIEAQRAALARAQGGRLSAAERAQFNAELNGESGRIYATKHNGRWGY
jgi:hypothetical protein